MCVIMMNSVSEFYLFLSFLSVYGMQNNLGSGGAGGAGGMAITANGISVTPGE